MEHIDMNIERVCVFACEKVRERGGWKEYESVRVSLREIEEKGKKRNKQREIGAKTENKRGRQRIRWRDIVDENEG